MDMSNRLVFQRLTLHERKLMNLLHDGCTHRNRDLVLEYKGHREVDSIAVIDLMKSSALGTVSN